MGGSTTPQGGTIAKGFLEREDFNERAAIVWPLGPCGQRTPYGRSSGYGRSPGYDLTAPTRDRRKAQGIDKGI